MPNNKIILPYQTRLSHIYQNMRSTINKIKYAKQLEPKKKKKNAPTKRPNYIMSHSKTYSTQG